MKYLSVCSGIEAATVAWHPMGWEPVAFSEIEKFPSQVLAHHYPNVPNLGDMTKFKEWKIDSNIDVFVGGTPCQSFSVAGLRKGLDDPRGNLMLTYLAIADKYRPKWLVWENVPGVLSSNDGKDFGTFLGGLGELGYGFAYRVLDAQYFGVAQRRRRVFVVGYLGDWRPAAAVLFERHSLSGDITPSREKRKRTTKYAERGIAEVSPTITCELAKQVNNQMVGNADAFFIPDQSFTPSSIGGYSEGVGTLRAHGGDIGGGSENLIVKESHIQAQCFEPRSPDGHARLIGDISPTLNTMGGGQREPCVIVGEVEEGGKWWDGGDIAATITTRSDSQKMPDKANAQLVIQPAVKPTYSLQGGGHTSQNSQGSGWNEEVSFTLNCMDVHGVVQPKAYSFDSLASNSMKSANPDSGCREVNVAKTLDTTNPEPSKNQGGIAIVQPVPYDLHQVTAPVNSQNRKPGDPCHTLAKENAHNAGIVQQMVFEGHGKDARYNQVKVSPTVCAAYGEGGGNIPLVSEVFPISTQNALGRVGGRDDWPLGIGKDGDPAPTLTKAHGHAVAHSIVHGTQDPCVSDIAFAQGTNNGGENVLIQEVVAPSLTTNNPSRSPQASEVTQQINAVYQTTMAVRRLTPVECERLQGFPDNYTNIKPKGKDTPDGPRYKALGNSMAVPVMAWIGNRINMYEQQNDR